MHLVEEAVALSGAGCINLTFQEPLACEPSAINEWLLCLLRPSLVLRLHHKGLCENNDSVADLKGGGK